eukprot:10593759-Lingulodinium_polyedra.AAC.1
MVNRNPATGQHRAVPRPSCTGLSRRRALSRPVLAAAATKVGASNDEAAPDGPDLADAVTQSGAAGVE